MQVIRGHATPERTPTRLKLIFRSANGNSASTSEVKKTRLMLVSQNLGKVSQKLDLVSQILGNPKISENSCKLPCSAIDVEPLIPLPTVDTTFSSIVTFIALFLAVQRLHPRLMMIQL